MRRVVNGIAASAEEWGISPRVAWMIVWAPIVGAMAVFLTYFDRSLFRFVTMEDGPIEWLQFVCYALACVAGAGVAYQRFKAGHRWQALMFLGFAVANFFIAGEEIAWGQRIFGLQTPEELKAINHQGEITVHNIQIIQDAFNIVLFLAGFYGSIAYFANQKLGIERFGDQANYLLVPPLFLVPSFLVLFGYKFIRYTLVRSPGFIVTKYGEWPELCLAFGFAIFAWLNYWRLVAKPRAMPAMQQIKIGNKA